MKLRNKFRDYVSGQISGHTDNFETSQNNIITLLRQGYSLFDSIKNFGYDETKIKRWYNEGSRGVPDYYNFYMVCDSFVSEEIKNHDMKMIYNKLKEGKSFLNAIGDGNFKVDTYNSSEIIKEWVILGKNGEKDFKEFYDVIKKYAFPDLLDLDIEVIIDNVNRNANNSSFLNSDALYSRRGDFGRWYKNANRSDERYIKLNRYCGDFFKRNSKDQFLYKLNKGFILGESFETDFHRFQDFLRWYIAGSKGDTADVLFYKNVRSLLIRNNNFNEHNHIFDDLKPDVPFEKILDNISKTYVDEWLRLGQYGLEPFYSFYNDYLKHDTQFKVISALKEGYEFNEKIPNLNHDFETVISWFDEKGDFYNICINIFISSTEFKQAKAFLNTLTPGTSLNKAIGNANISSKNIEKWMEFGKEGYEPFSKFYTGLLKTVILKGLTRRLSFEETFNLLDSYYSMDEFRNAYDNDVKFQNKFSQLLVKNTNFDKAKPFLEGFNLENTLDENLYDYEISYNELNQWISLANSSFKPFDQFLEVYNKYLTQNKVILDIKQGATFEQAINISNPIFHDQEIRSWYDSGEGNFYEICYKLTEKESQKLVISYLKQGLTFDSAINQENLLHKSKDIHSWFLKGKNGDERYLEFYDDVEKTILIGQLKKGLYLNNAIAASSGLIGLDHIKQKYREDQEFYDEVNELLIANTFFNKNGEVLNYLDAPFPYYVVEWLNLAENGFDPFVVFYRKYKNLIENIQKVVIDSLNEGKSFEEIMQLKEVNCSINVLKTWYEEGSNGNSDFKEFYEVVDNYKKKLNAIKNSEKSNALDVVDKNKVIATQKFIIDDIVKGLNFEDIINQDYLYFTPETIEKWYFEGLISKKFANFSNIIYNHIKNTKSPILIKSFILLKMKNGVRFREISNLQGFKSQFSTIEQWYNEGLKGKKEHKVFANIVKEYDEKIQEWRIIQEKKRLEAEKKRLELIKKQKADEERKKEQAKQKMIAEEKRKLEKKRRKEDELKEQIRMEEQKRMDLMKQLEMEEQKNSQNIDQESSIKLQKNDVSSVEQELENAKIKIKDNIKNKTKQKEKTKIKELKMKEKEHRQEREERLKRQRENLQKTELVNEIK